MKTATLSLSLSLVLILSLTAAPARASDYFQRLECDWQRALAEIRSDIATSEALLRLPCDAQLHAAVRHRFQHIDRETLDRYNRGLFVSPYPTRPVVDASVLGPR